MPARPSRFCAAVPLIAALLIVAPAAEAAFPGANGQIAFVRDDRVMTVGANGGSPKAVTAPSKVFYEGPAWSADGKRLAFDGWRYKRLDTRGYISDGGTIRRTRFGSDFAWSPSGARLAAVLDGPKLVIARPAGRATTTLLSLPETSNGYANVIADPALSPDGRWIVYGEGPKPPGPNPTLFSLFKISASGGHPRRIVEDGETPNWSPDGRRIVFAKRFGSRDNIRGTIWIANADGSGARRLTPVSRDLDETPAFSPNGKLIVFTRYAAIPGHSSPAPAALMVMRPDGTGLRKLGNGVEGSEPDWQPLPQ